MSNPKLIFITMFLLMAFGVATRNKNIFVAGVTVPLFYLSAFFFVAPFTALQDRKNADPPLEKLSWYIVAVFF